MKYFKNTSWLMLEKLLRIVIAFFVGVWVTRYLGPERLGVLSYAQSLAFLFSAFATLGLDSIVVREIVKDPENKDVLLGTAFFLKVIGALVSLMLLFAAVLVLDVDKETQYIIFLVGLGALFQSFYVIDFYFQSKVQAKFIVYSQLIGMVLINCFKVGLIVNGASLRYFAACSAIEIFIITLGLLFFYRYTDQEIFCWRWSSSIAKKMLKDSSPLILSGLMISLYMKIDQVMIMAMLGADAVGQYSAALRLSEVWYFIPVVICNSLFPALIDAKKLDKEQYERQLQNLFTLLIWISICIAIPFTVFGNWIVLSLYGNSYEMSSSVLRIHIWAGVFVGVGVASGKYFICENLQKFNAYRTILGILVNILLNLLLIPYWGIIGAAIATLLSQFCAAVLSDLLWNSTRKIFFMKLRSVFRNLSVL